MVSGTVSPENTIHTVRTIQCPYAISVAAVNEAGVGDHCPLVKIANDSACKWCRCSVHNEIVGNASLQQRI